jgi:hypothetical protein
MGIVLARLVHRKEDAQSCYYLSFHQAELLLSEDYYYSPPVD